MRPVPGGRVVTVDLEGEQIGLTVSSLVSLSLEPPLVGISISRFAALHELLRRAREFASSILGEGQEALAQHFARGVPPIALWEGIERRSGATGAPLLEGAVGWIECRLRHEYEVGDHTLFVGEVIAVERGPGHRAARPRRIVVPAAVIDAVIFDMDGVLLESEQVWDQAREQLTAELGGRWHEGAQRDMMGMSSLEWSRYMHDELGVPLPPQEISDEVVRRLERLYREHLPLLPGAREAVERLAAVWPLAVASSSNRPLIELVLDLAGIADRFQAIVSSEEVERGKPAPDVYLEAARRLEVDPTRCAAIEDSENGLLAARAAGMRVLAIPNREFPPSEDALSAADVVLDSLSELDPATIDPAAA